MRNQLKRNYKASCNDYLKAFCEKHDYDFEDARKSWVGDRVGEVVEVADYYVDMTTIRTDIDKDAPEEEFVKWYDYDLTMKILGEPSMNFDHWLMDAPRKSKEEIQDLETAYQRESSAFSPKCVDTNEKRDA